MHREGAQRMDTRPIGVFDSGLGGLTALRELTALLPREEFIYFGDTGRVPYGSRSRDTLIKYARQDVAFLRAFGPKAIVIACGTVSTNALDVLRGENEIPIFGVVGPAARAAARTTRSGKIGLIGTSASIRTGAYERAIAPLRPDAQVTALACPLFVPLVENGRVDRGDVVIETVAREYLEPLLETGIDTLILGCTHYPLLEGIIAEICGPGVTLVSAGEESAFELKRLLKAQGLRGPEDRRGEADFYVSDTPENFEELASLFLREDLHHAARRINIDEY